MVAERVDEDVKQENQAAVLTFVAVKPRKAALELTTAQEALEGLVHKARECLTLVSKSVIELGEVTSYRSIE